MDEGEPAVTPKKYDGTNRRFRQAEFSGVDQRNAIREARKIGRMFKWVCGAIIAMASTTVAINQLGAFMPETAAHAAEIQAKNADAHAATNQRVSSLEQDVTGLQRDVSGILSSGKKTQLLATRSRLQEIKDRMAKLQPNSDVWSDYRRELIQLQDDEEVLRKELGR